MTETELRPPAGRACSLFACTMEAQGANERSELHRSRPGRQAWHGTGAVRLRLTAPYGELSR